MKNMIKAVLFSSLILASLFVCSCDKVSCPTKGEDVPPQPKPNPPTPVDPTITTWTSIAPTTTNTLLDVSFVNANTGFIVGNNGTILKTTNGGDSWSILTSGTSSNLRSIYMFDASKGFAVGDGGVLLKTSDGGTTWQETIMPGNVTFTKILFLDNAVGFIGGGTPGTLLKTTDGGNTWNNISYGSSGSLYDIYFLNSQVGYICGQLGFIAKTTDGGNTWTAQSSGIDSPTPSDLLLKIKFADANNGYTIGAQMVAGATVFDTYILSTKDGGQSWIRGNYPFSNIMLTGLDVINATNAYAVGGDISANTYCITKTTDGQNWTTVSTGDHRLADIFLFNPASKGISVGLDGVIIRGN